MNAVFLDRATFTDTINMPTDIGLNDWQNFETTSPDQVIERCKNADIVITNKVVFNTENLTQLPKLKLIAVTATGVNNIDLEACSKLNITVVNATAYGTDSVAEHALMLMLALNRNLPAYMSANTQKQWSDSPFFHDPLAPIHTLASKTLCIVGKGELGKGMAKRAMALDMNVVFAERPSAQTIREGYTPFEDAFKNADVISLHCPLTPQTQHLINKQTLSLLKPTALLINTGRGALVNEVDLLEHLKAGQLAGAGLDVANVEPPAKTDPIWDLAALPNVIVTPHVAWAAEESMQRLMDQIGIKIQKFISHDPITNLAQPI